MFFWGWGNNSKQWQYGDKFIVVTWTYFHLFFFPIGFNIKWHLMGDSRSEDQVIPYSKVQELLPNETPKLNIWHRYGLLLGIAALFIIGFVRSFFR